MRIAEVAAPTAGRPDLLWWTLGSFCVLLGWDASELDLPLARWMAGGHAFGLREHWIFAGVLHDGVRPLAWLLALWLAAGVWAPSGILRQVRRAARIQWFVGTVASLLLISALKYSSQTSCPWDLAEFGGAGNYFSHWAWGQTDGGPGHCFPAGHASAAFAFIGGYFAVRHAAPRRARMLAAIVLAAGLALGVAQQFRGAHFMSHTLWTAWVCWTVAHITDAVITSLGHSAQPSLPCHETA
jgi:membrane-associated PAP2 superfamily phosphatase